MTSEIFRSTSTQSFEDARRGRVYVCVLFIRMSVLACYEHLHCTVYNYIKKQSHNDMLSHFKAIKVEINRGDVVDTVFWKKK